MVAQKERHTHEHEHAVIGCYSSMVVRLVGVCIAEMTVEERVLADGPSGVCGNARAAHEITHTRWSMSAQGPLRY